MPEEKSYKVQLYEEMEKLNPEIIIHMSIQAAIDKSKKPVDVYIALSNLQFHVQQACVVTLKMLQDSMPVPFESHRKERKKI